MKLLNRIALASYSFFHQIVSFFSHQRVQFLTLALISLSGIFLIVARAYRARYSLGIDTISYISIANHWANWRVEEGLNAFWSPLVTWLMVPFIKFGFTGSVAFLAINIVAAVLIMFAGIYFLRRVVKDPFVLQILFLAMVIPFLIRNISTLMPDMLLAAWVMWLGVLAIKLDETLGSSRQPASKKSILIIGAMGALGYFIKLYALPLFAAFLMSWYAIRVYLSEDYRNFINPLSLKKIFSSIIPFVLIVGVMMLIMAPWVAGLSFKYEKLMLGSGGTNVSNQFRQTNFLETEDQFDIPLPPNNHATLYGEDRTARWTIEPSEQEKNLDTIGKAKLFLQRAKSYAYARFEAFPFYVNRVTSMWPFIVPVMIVVGLALALGFLSYKRHRHIILFYALLIIYFAGYAAITNRGSGGGNVRYYWPVYLMSAIIFLSVVPLLWQRVQENGQKLGKLFIVVLIGLAAYAPTVHNVMGYNHFYHIKLGNPLTLLGPGPSSSLEIFGEPFKSYDYRLAEIILQDEIIPPGSVLMGNNYRRVARLAYYHQSQAYGQSNMGLNYMDDALRGKLGELEVDYFFYFSPVPEEDPQVVELLKLSGAEIENILQSSDNEEPSGGEEGGDDDSAVAGDQYNIAGLDPDEVEWILRYSQPLELHDGDEIVGEYVEEIGCSDLRSPVIRPCRIQVIKLN